MLLTLKEIEEISGGKWYQLANKTIKPRRVVSYVGSVEPGDLFCPFSSRGWIKADESNTKAIRRAKEKGAVGVVLPNKSNLETDDLPVLKVDGMRDTYRAIAIANSKKSKAMNILVTGSYGKTGTKIHLYHLLKNFKNTHATLNSANESIPIYRTMMNIKEHHDIAIVEVAAPGYNISRTRSSYVEPDIAIITAIGAEHLKQHGGKIENVIENKSRVAYGLSDGGYMIIPDQKKYSTKEKMKEYIRNINPTVNVLSFGEDDENDAYIESKEFKNPGWDVLVNINKKRYSVFIPFLEEYAVKAILPCLLTCDLLGLDITEVAKGYESIKNYKSSGNFYKIDFEDKSFYLYDQCRRGILDGFKETLNIISMLQPKNGGRKIALFSEFISFSEAGVEEVNLEEFQELFSKSGLDILFSTHRFYEHINVLPNKNIWKEHFSDLPASVDEILGMLRDEDMLFVRATRKSNAKVLTSAILERAINVRQFY